MLRQLLPVSQTMNASIGVNIVSVVCSFHISVPDIQTTIKRHCLWWTWESLEYVPARPVDRLLFHIPQSMSLLFSTFTTTMANVTRSTGQGNLFSRVPSYSPSIVIGLHSRALTGRSLNINVHQHLGYRLHLVWNSTKNCVTSERSVERRFLMYEDFESFCTELVNGEAESLCDCVGEGVLPDKAERDAKGFGSTGRN